MLEDELPVGVGGLTEAEPPRVLLIEVQHMAAETETNFRRWRVLEYSCAAKLLWNAGAGWALSTFVFCCLKIVNLFTYAKAERRCSNSQQGELQNRNS